MQIETIDLEYQGTPGVIAAFLIHGPEGPVLIETGPGSTLPTLLAALRKRNIDPGDIRDVLVTHIHLDHSGAAGWWARQGTNIHVHTVGAPHIVDPTKLLKSATKIYGDRMDRLWGETLPAPPERVFAVEDRDRLRVGGLEITAIATHGHAWHHLVYHLGDIAFSGDSAGIRLANNLWIDLPAPPPEFNLDAWRETLKILRSLELKTLYRTHFGPGNDAGAELDQFEQVLESAAGWVREMMIEGLDRDSMITAFTEKMRTLAQSEDLTPELLCEYELANPRDMSVDGIARYWSKRI